MKKTDFLCIIAVVLVLTGCTQTKYGMTKSALENAIEDVKVDVQQKGYYMISENIGTDISATFSSSRDARNSVWSADLANTKVNQYHFADSAGNTFSFAVAYNEALSKNTLYVLETNVISCETSKPKDNLLLCGKESAVGKIKTLSNDKPIVVGDKAASEKTVTWLAWGGLGAAIIFCIIVLKSI